MCEYEFLKEPYNKDIKCRFISEIGIDKYPPRWWERLFEKSSLFEYKYNKDFYSFTTNEILEFYKFLFQKSLDSLMVYNINLIKYGDWALNNNLIYDGQNHFREIDNELLVTCIDKGLAQQSIISYDLLSSLTGNFENQKDKYVVYALFEGIKGRDYLDLYNLKLSDIDESNKTATLYSGRTIVVSDRFIEICKLAYDEKEYITSAGRKRPLYSLDNRIFKEIGNTKENKIHQLIYRNILRAIKQLGLSSSITGNNIATSGMIHYLNKKAAELGITGVELMENDMYKNEREEIFQKYNFNKNVRIRFLLQYREFLQ